MIVIDTSALLAIAFGEPERALLRQVLAAQAHNVMSAVNLHEALIVVRIRQGLGATVEVWALLETHTVEIVAFDEPQVRGAATAFGRFGKGLHSRAKLNLCDCAAYALAKSLDAPLLFKGDDFTHTDVVAAA